MTHAGAHAFPPPHSGPPAPVPAATAAPDSTSVESDGAEERLVIVDQVCHGIHRALNNRIGSLSALLELTRLGDLPANDPAFASLSSELTRLEECARTVGLMPRAMIGEEPLIVDDVIADAIAFHAFLHEWR